MAGLRVFVSSTCFDLGSSREQLRNLLIRMGYEPVMSEYSDILYDPQDHTHVSCVRDVINADMVVLMIGSRLGGAASDQVLPILDFTKLSDSSASIELLSSKDKMSITQVEVLRAIELDIPLFAFVDEKVYADHHLYQSNKSNPILDKINFPSIDKPETAKYIFEFINLIRHRTTNNAIVGYKNFAEIEDHLIRQWSLLFQRMLRDRRDSSIEQRRSDLVLDQIEGLKAAVLQSISTDDARDVARSVLRYRRLADVLIGLRTGPNVVDVDNFGGSFQDLLKSYGIVDILDYESLGMFRTYFVRDDETFYQVRFASRLLNPLNVDWEDFKKVSPGVRHAVIEAIGSTERSLPIVMYRSEKFGDFRRRMDQEYSSSSNVASRLLQEISPPPIPSPPQPTPPPKTSTRRRGTKASNSSSKSKDS